MNIYIPDTLDELTNYVKVKENRRWIEYRVGTKFLERSYIYDKTEDKFYYGEIYTWSLRNIPCPISAAEDRQLKRFIKITRNRKINRVLHKNRIKNFIDKILLKFSDW